VVDFEKDGDGFVEIPIEKLHALRKKQEDESGKPREAQPSAAEPKARASGSFTEDSLPDESEKSEKIEGKEIVADEKPKIVLIDEPKPKIVDVKRNILTQGIPEDRVRLRDLPQAYREQAAQDVLPVKNEPDLRSDEGREAAADLAREIYAKNQEEKKKSQGFFGKVKGAFGFG
jgi:hypothetical protein